MSVARNDRLNMLLTGGKDAGRSPACPLFSPDTPASANTSVASPATPATPGTPGYAAANAARKKHRKNSVVGLRGGSSPARPFSPLASAVQRGGGGSGQLLCARCNHAPFATRAELLAHKREKHPNGSAAKGAAAAAAGAAAGTPILRRTAARNASRAAAAASASAASSASSAMAGAAPVAPTSAVADSPRGSAIKRKRAASPPPAQQQQQQQQAGATPPAAAPRISSRISFADQPAPGGGGGGGGTPQPPQTRLQSRLQHQHEQGQATASSSSSSSSSLRKRPRPDPAAVAAVAAAPFAVPPPSSATKSFAAFFTPGRKSGSNSSSSARGPKPQSSIKKLLRSFSGGSSSSSSSSSSSLPPQTPRRAALAATDRYGFPAADTAFALPRRAAGWDQADEDERASLLEHRWRHYLESEGAGQELCKGRAPLPPAVLRERRASLLQARQAARCVEVGQLTVLHGLAASLRPQAWALWSGGDALRCRAAPRFYAASIGDPTVPAGERAAVAPLPDEKTISQIEVDIRRTCPTHPYFQRASGLIRLRRMLVALATLHGDIGYTQSMNFIAGFLLLVCDDEEEEEEEEGGEEGGQEGRGGGDAAAAAAGGDDRRAVGGRARRRGGLRGNFNVEGATSCASFASAAADKDFDEEVDHDDMDPQASRPFVPCTAAEERAFWITAATVGRLRGNYEVGMAGLKADSATLQTLMADHMPALAAMFERNCLFLEILTPPWFMCLFFTWLPAETTARLWDVLFWAGEDAAGVLLWAALALLKLAEPTLLRRAASAECELPFLMETLKAAGRGLVCFGDLLKAGVGGPEAFMCAAQLRAGTAGLKAVDIADVFSPPPAAKRAAAVAKQAASLKKLPASRKASSKKLPRARPSYADSPGAPGEENRQRGANRGGGGGGGGGGGKNAMELQVITPHVAKRSKRQRSGGAKSGKDSSVTALVFNEISAAVAGAAASFEQAMDTFAQNTTATQGFGSI